MKKALLAALCMSCLCWETSAQIEIGKQAPDVKWETVFESDPESLGECKGKLVLLYFLSSSSIKDKPRIKKLNGWYDLFKQRGLLLVCVFKQKTDRLEKWVDEYKIDFPLVSGRDAYKKFNVTVTPSYYVISGDGKVLHRDWSAVPKRKLLEKYLALHVTPLELRGGEPFDAIVAAWKKMRFGDVSKLIAKAQKEAKDPEVKKELLKAQNSLKGQMTNAGQEMSTLHKGPDYWAAYNRCLEIEREYKGLTLAAKAKQIRKDFRADKRIVKEMKAIQQLRKLEHRYDLVKEPKKRSKLLEKLRDFIAKYPGLGASRLAKDVMDGIQ